MEISKDDFFSLSNGLEIPPEKAENLWKSLEGRSKSPQPLVFSKVIYYLGALIVIGAMTWFMGLSWELFGGGGIFLIASIYAVFSALLGARLWQKKDLRVPAGLLITIAVCMVPLAIYGLENYFGIWLEEGTEPYSHFFARVEGRWIFMEIGTILAGLIALRFFSFPFLTVPIIFSLWFFSLDVVPLILGKNPPWQQTSWITLFFGLGLILVGYLSDLYQKEKYAFWCYLFGVFFFWISLGSLVWDKTEAIWLIYLGINVVLMIVSILLQRKIFLVFGALGIFFYLSHLAYDVFEDLLWFPFVLSFLGFALIYVGFLYQKNAKWIENSIWAKIPPKLHKYLPHSQVKRRDEEV